ncbi:chitinase [Dichomitus squalens]|uniref:Chitinase n=1 Tax=Dichomitus squalens TaxID=114155 RepID=A0A4Q9P3K0_9APHY|nr:chitinase [Dichomitus squalens]TBU59727.1 chitinase [Dichomitus squalens]
MMYSLFSFSLLILSLVAGSTRSLAHPRKPHGADPHNHANASRSSSLVSAAWYAGWHSDDFPLASVSWNKYTHLTYSFAVTTPDVNTISLDGSNPDVLPQFVETAHNNGVKALVSVGGWTGSLYYSTAVGSAENRTAFVKTITDFATKYKLDGIDFDWEYPGTQGIGCNAVNADDTTNFLAFLRELRAHPVGKHLILTAATSVFPWAGPDGNQLSDVSGFAKELDWIAIMNYDVWGPWSATTGPNAPLNDTCASAENQQGSAVSAVAQWSAAGIPTHQIVLGVASYGHSFHVNVSDAIDDSGSLRPYAPFDAALQPTGDKWDDDAGVDECGNENGPGGNFDFWGLIDAGFLTLSGDPAPLTAYDFDVCSQTAYVYHEESEVFVSFDDARAFTAKGHFIKDTKLRGFAIWEAGGDFNDILLDAIRSGAGAA